jgi:hypothetical protein
VRRPQFGPGLDSEFVVAAAHVLQKGVAVLVDGPIHVPPDAVDLDVGLVYEPPVCRRTPSEPGGIGQ